MTDSPLFPVTLWRGAPLLPSAPAAQELLAPTSPFLDLHLLFLTSFGALPPPFRVFSFRQPRAPLSSCALQPLFSPFPLALSSAESRERA